jgi:hexosaminidase
VGGKFQVNAGWKFYRDVENSLCPSNEKVYEFLDKVFGEVAELFPHPYIHIGGDECYKGYWEKCRMSSFDEKRGLEKYG